MTCILCCQDIKENCISCENCNQKYNLLCIAGYTIENNKCPKCNIEFIPLENIFTEIQFYKMGLDNVKLISDFNEIILKNMNIRIKKTQYQIKLIKYKTNRIKNINYILFVILIFIIYQIYNLHITKLYLF
jgi:hypothetical protein